MADSFDLPVDFNGEEKQYPTTILPYGYTHKIQVTINDIIVTFEPDEELNYRAIIPPDTYIHIPSALLKEISLALTFLIHC